MKSNSPPASWLLILLAGISLLSETVYTPSLPAIARTLNTSAAMVEYTLTIYLFGIALGTLFWGKISDRLGRKPCIVAGLFVFVLGCFGCYFSSSITLLMWNRLLQSFGASIGSVLIQAICRDAFHGPALGKIYALVGASLSIFPIIGPMVGGLISEHMGWSNIFLFLILSGLVMIVLTLFNLKETHHPKNRSSISLLHVGKLLLKDKRVLGLGLIVAFGNGISFSYYSEGSFYLIKLLGVSPSLYGFTFIILALGTLFGGLTSRRLQNSHSSKIIMTYGIRIIFGGALFFSIIVLGHAFFSISQKWLIFITILSQTILVFGLCMTTSNALAIALVDYQWCVGTASSLFGFFYNVGIALLTFGMGVLHNGTLYPMPFYFLGMSSVLFIVKKFFLENEA